MDFKNDGIKKETWKEKVKQLVETKNFQTIVICIIVLNGLIIIGETYLIGNQFLLVLDNIIVWVFVIELLLKLYGLGFKRFFSFKWNIFDFIIVLGSLIFYTTPFVSVMRLLRVLRLLRMIPAVPALRKIVDALMKSVPALTGILGLSFLIFSIYAIIGTTYFSEVLPNEFFGSFHASLFTLMQVVTFESWASQVARPVMSEIPWAWVYFVSFIIIGALVILNLVVAVILSYLGQEDDSDQKEQFERLNKENQEIKREIQELKQLILNRENKSRD
ncbi:ion transporter [Pseudogracilibacillus auburnensis]|uniref:Voltage-gated sodium channel n=1 Tax=Pseudogracilibacillus auburnensis TaxID=1494959 RepID=A0A2V3VP14_9BACI|nr:ion transporter [Pseudogracilibacillus auburnensis]PXW83556.1 voltage-gated sodium channel [Pseudogracilibacillus auburnensis]